MEEGEDEPAFRQLQELLDESVPSRSKTVVMSAVGQKRCRSMSRDRRVYTYDKAIESQEVLKDSDEFQFNIDSDLSRDAGSVLRIHDSNYQPKK